MYNRRMETVVRPATPADAEALLSLIDALADYEKLERPTDEARRRLVEHGFGERPRFDCLLALQEGAAVGYAICFETYSTFLAQPTLYLEDLFVRPEARGSGAGRALFAAIEREALARGCGRLEWACLNWNQLAIDFYARRGAQHLDEWRSYRLTEDALRGRHG